MCVEILVVTGDCEYIDVLFLKESVTAKREASKKVQQLKFWNKL